MRNQPKKREKFSYPFVALFSKTMRNQPKKREKFSYPFVAYMYIPKIRQICEQKLKTAQNSTQTGYASSPSNILIL